MIKKLIPTLVVTGGAVFLLWLIQKYFPIIEVASQTNGLAPTEEDTKPEEIYEEKRRPGHEDRRKALRDWAMSRPRRKDELIH